MLCTGGGWELPAQASRGRPARFHDAACRQRAHRARRARHDDLSPPAVEMKVGMMEPGPTPSALALLAGLVVAGRLAGDDVEAVPGVDVGDQALPAPRAVPRRSAGRRWPSFVGDAARCVGDTGSLFGELEGGAFGFGEDGCFSPGRHQIDAELAFSGVCGVLGVHVGARPAAVDLAGSKPDQFLRCGGKGRLGYGLSRGDEALGVPIVVL